MRFVFQPPAETAAGLLDLPWPEPVADWTDPQPELCGEGPIGLQLYSVREDCARDLPGTLDAVARMGYVAVEFAGYYNRSAQELRKLLGPPKAGDRG